MNQVPVKWVGKSYLLCDKQTKVGQPRIPVIPLSALREVVEGLKKIAGYHWQADSIKEAQRLLAGLGEVEK